MVVRKVRLVNAIALALLAVVKLLARLQALDEAAVCAGIRVNLAQWNKYGGQASTSQIRSRGKSDTTAVAVISVPLCLIFHSLHLQAISFRSLASCPDCLN